MLPSSDSLPVEERKKNMCSRRGKKKNNAKISHQRNFDPLKLSLISKLANF